MGALQPPEDVGGLDKYEMRCEQVAPRDDTLGPDTIATGVDCRRDEDRFIENRAQRRSASRCRSIRLADTRRPEFCFRSRTCSIQRSTEGRSARRWSSPRRYSYI